MRKAGHGRRERKEISTASTQESKSDSGIKQTRSNIPVWKYLQRKTSTISVGEKQKRKKSRYVKTSFLFIERCISRLPS